MRTIVFETEGLLDFSALLKFGISSKPKTNSPIGYFGTGLKYAIAILVRHHFTIKIYRGNEIWRVIPKELVFRNKEFTSISLLREGPHNQEFELPFTTELGKDWKLWQAYRELHSNTLDENGAIYESGIANESRSLTRIAVSSNDFAGIYDNRSDIFYNGHNKRDEGIDIFDETSHHIFYRGVRIFSPPLPMILTYNIHNKMELTEDRTLKHEWFVRDMIRDFFINTESEDLLIKVLKAKNTSFEGKINFSDAYGAPPEFFKDVVKKLNPSDINTSALRYIAAHEPDEDELIRRRVRTELWDLIYYDSDNLLDYIRKNKEIILEII